MSFQVGPFIFEPITSTTCRLTSCDPSVSGDISIPSIASTYTVTSIGSNGVFANLSSITSITIPDTITYIGSYAFSFCSRITSITIPNSVIYIGEKAFWYCSSLTSITIPNSVTSIGYMAFMFCSRLTTVLFLCNYNSGGYISSNIFIESNPNVYCAYATKDSWSGVTFNGNPVTPVGSIVLSSDVIRNTVSGGIELTFNLSPLDNIVADNADEYRIYYTSEYTNGSPIKTYNESNPIILTTTIDTITNTQCYIIAYSDGIQLTAPQSPAISIPNPCLPAGERVMTPSGPRAVEDLRDGDEVLTEDGRVVPVKMHAHTTMSSNATSAPIKIAAGAFDGKYPKAPLRLSPWHAFKVGEVDDNAWQIPKDVLAVAGVEQEPLGQYVQYYHIELPDFFRDNLVVEGGAVVESYGLPWLTANNMWGRKIFEYNSARGCYERRTPEDIKKQ